MIFVFNQDQQVSFIQTQEEILKRKRGYTFWNLPDRDLGISCPIVWSYDIIKEASESSMKHVSQQVVVVVYCLKVHDCNKLLQQA